MIRPLSRTQLKNTKHLLLDVCEPLWAINILLLVLPCHFGTRLGRLGGVGCFFKGKVLSNRDPGGEREQDGHVTRRPRHKENGETHTKTKVLIYQYMNINERTLAGSVPDGVHTIQDACYLVVTLFFLAN